jgi:hypothetical protein
MSDIPTTPPMPQGTPAQKRFELADVVRIPVHVTPEAQAMINASSAEGRKLPQALAESFGALRNVARVYLMLVPKSTIHPITQAEKDELGGKEPTLLRIVAEHLHPQVPQYVWHVNARDLAYVHPSGKGFRAHLLADLLVTQYPYRTHPAPLPH